MTKTQIIFLVVFSVLALVIGGATFTAMNGRPGEGEVSVILHGGLIVIGLGLTALCTLLALAAAFWQVKAIRAATLCGIALLVLIPAVKWAHQEIKIYTWERKNQRLEAEATDLVARYDARLMKAPRDKATLIQLRRDLEKDMRSQGFSWSAGGITDWYWKHSLVTRVFTDPSYDPSVLFGMIDYPSATACTAFRVEYPNALDTPAREAIYRNHCPDRLLK